jgi:hypothetical protein
MQLNVPVFRIEHVMQLTVNTGSKMLVTEHSDMGNMPLLSQLYDDACDVGLAMLNTQTGAQTRWHLLREEKDAEGDLQVTVFAPCHETLRMHRALQGWTLHVLND